jgi:hypothetical protein
VAAAWPASGADAGGCPGQWFSATPIALALAVVFAVLLLRDLRRPGPVA